MSTALTDTPPSTVTEAGSDRITTSPAANGRVATMHRPRSSAVVIVVPVPARRDGSILASVGG